MRLTNSLYKGISQALDHYGRYHPSVLSIQKFIDFGKKKNSERGSFVFLRKEIPVRLANIIKEIYLLPDQLLLMPSIKTVTNWYEQSFEDIIKYEDADPNNSEVLGRFLLSLDSMRDRHSTVVETMAEGVVEMRDHLMVDGLRQLDQRIHYFLDRFYLSRISIRLIIHQHLLLFGNSQGDKSSFIGCFDPNFNVLKVAKDAYEKSKFLCKQYYERAPDCEFITFKSYKKVSSDNNSDSDDDDDDDAITMIYVPVHLYYMLFELFKNSMRAVVELNKDTDLPALKLLISQGREDVTIKLIDRGGGVARQNIDKVFNYLYTTANVPNLPSNIPPLAGYGYGLPLARLYAKYFNGDLTLSSVDGYGTDALIYLKVLPREASELLPIYNKTSSLKYTEHTQIRDWSEPFKTPKNI